MTTNPNSPAKGADHWLVRPGTIRNLWILFIAILGLTVLAELVVEMHAEIEAAHWFGFNAVYGFLACVVTVAAAKLFGVFVKRPEDYYDRRHDAAGEDRV